MAVAHEHEHDDERVVVERDRAMEPRPVRAVVATTAPNIVRLVLTIAGAAGVIAGALMTWVNGNQGTQLPLRSFYRPTLEATSSFITSPGAVMILLGLMAVLGMATRSGWLTRIAGTLGIIALVLVTIEMNRAGLSLPSSIGVGMWVCLVGSLVALIGGFFAVTPYLMDEHRGRRR